jgi:hypothetical protein
LLEWCSFYIGSKEPVFAPILPDYLLVTYCGKRIRVVGDEVWVDQVAFSEGRLDPISVSSSRSRESESPASKLEYAEFCSVVGSLQWLAAQTRPDIAFDVNQLQKRRSVLSVKDLVETNKLVKVVKGTMETCVRIRGCERPHVVCWHDSGLTNSFGDAINDDEFSRVLAREGSKGVHSQVGVMCGIAESSDMSRNDPFRVNVVDWRSKTARRVVTSSFAAEANAALEGVGMGMYVQSLVGEVLFGRHCLDKNGELSPQVIGLSVVTDCNSLYDHVRKESSVPEDRRTALSVAALKQSVSCGVGRDEKKAELLWVPTRSQQADGLTKRGLGHLVREFLQNCQVCLREVSAKALKIGNRQKSC